MLNRYSAIARAALLALGLSILAAHVQAQTPAKTVKLSLAEAIRFAQDTSPQVALAQLHTEETNGKLTEARSVYYPTVNGAVSFTRRTMNKESFGIEFPTLPGQTPLPLLIGPFSVFDVRPQIAQTLVAPADWMRARAARDRVAESHAETSTTKQAVIAQTGMAYVETARAHAALDAREEDLRIARELQTVADRQFKAGVGTKLDVVRSQSQVTTARSGIELARAALTQAEIALARALNLPSGSSFELTDTLSNTLAHSGAPLAREQAIALALEKRPELDAAQASLQATETGRKAISLERFGRLQAATDWGANGPLPTENIRTWQFAVQYTIPAFEGFRREGRMQEQEAQVRAAAVRLSDLRQQIAADVESALADVASGEAQQTIAVEQVQLATEELREARLRFQNGIAGNIEVVNAQSDLSHARSALVDAQAHTAAARVRLARAVGVAPTLQ